MVFAALEDLVPLYPVYALLFADTGLSGGQIGSLLVIWSFVSMVAEVPSGALADRISRRHLLMASGAIRGAGFALWVVFPSYPAFVLGFVLWGAAGALTSGTLEALIYDTLTEFGAPDRYASVRARVGAAQLLAELA
ncbi:MAG: MFS transporter, partial [Pseudonocardiaceae bacterium]|nr:MFS transporter [Pseudonocardiaceae bacterium]